MSGHYRERHDTGEQVEMDYTEQCLHMLDEWDSARGFKIRFQPGARNEMSWTVEQTRQIGRGPVAWVCMDDGAGYGAGVSRQEAYSDALAHRRRAEEALTLAEESVRVRDAAKRLGGAP